MSASLVFARAAAILRPLPFVASAAFCLHWSSLPEEAGSVSGREEAQAAMLDDEYELSAMLASELQLRCSPSDVFFVDEPRGWPEVWAPARAFVLGTRGNDQNDVFLVWLRRSPEGRILSIDRALNLSQTSAVSEEQLASSDGLAAWLIGNEQSSFRLKIADAKRKPKTDPRARSGLKRVQQALTFFQQTGQFAGLAERDFKFDPPAKWVRIKASTEGLSLLTDHTSGQSARADVPAAGIVIPRDKPMERGGHLLAEQSTIRAAPGNLITWAVDRVRDMPWFRDDWMQLAKALAYKVLDFKDRTLGDEASDATRTLPSYGVVVDRRTFGGAEVAFPPAPLAPQLDPPFEKEGVWLGLEKDPFVRKLPNGSSPFATTFIRTDKERKFSRIMITTWDPSVVELHMMSGTEEPKSATGETGSGLVPRDPDTLERLVAAFNGGFQGTHGDFGMQVNGTLYVPPKPYAATVARLSDGRVGFGTWPEQDGKAIPVPAYVASFRQNLTPLIQAGKVNPYGRTWWGGVPHEWEDDTRTVRSGLCLTKKGLLAYFYGSKVDHQHLARAMQLTECEYGMHLDMNQGHTGLEFYHVAQAESLPPLGMPPDTMWQAEGAVEDARGFNFRGRRLFRSMQLMNFPRYIRREARDFFYLTLRRQLPGPALALPGKAADPMEGRWSTDRFPAVEGVPAVAEAWFRPAPSRPGAKVRLLGLDPSRVAPGVSELKASPVLLSIDPGPELETDTTAWWHHGEVSIAAVAPPGAQRLVSGTRSPGTETRAAFGLGPRSKFFYYAEVATAPEPEKDAELLREALQSVDVGTIIYLRERPVLSRDGHELSGHPYSPSENARALVAHVSPWFRQIFKNAAVRERTYWKPLQKNKD